MSILSPPSQLSVAVVIASNRPGQFLEEALHSVARQTTAPTEVIVVNDGGNERAFENLRSWGTVTTFLTQPSLGVSIARNRGLLAASGDLVAFLDDDDRWPPHRLAAHVSALSAHPAAVMSADSIVHIDERGKELFRTELPPSLTPADVMSREVGLLLPNCVVRRDAALLVGGFHPALKRSQDFDFLLNLLRLGTVVRAQSYCEYRSHPQNATSRHREVADFQLLVAQIHRTSARWAGQKDEERSLKDFSRRAQRFAGWSAQRAIRDHTTQRRPLAALDEATWLIRRHPGALGAWLSKRAATGLPRGMRRRRS